MSDEFIPKQYDGELDFWRVPKGVANHTELSWGAKVLYGVIYGHAHKTGEARPSYKALQKWMGNPSKATMQRWIKELVDARMVRAIQRGRGNSNVYRMLRSPFIGNMSEEEYAEGLKFVYTGSYTGEPLLVDELTSIQYYYCELRDWVNKSVRPDDYPMPKRQFNVGPHEKQASEDAKWEVIDRYLFEYNPIPGVPFEINDDQSNNSDKTTATEWVIPDGRD